jgi:hypothetical protein
MPESAYYPKQFCPGLPTCIPALVKDLQAGLTSQCLTTSYESFGAKDCRPSRRKVRELRVVGRVNDVPVDSRHFERVTGGLGWLGDGTCFEVYSDDACSQSS